MAPNFAGIVSPEKPANGTLAESNRTVVRYQLGVSPVSVGSDKIADPQDGTGNLDGGEDKGRT